MDVQIGTKDQSG